MAAGMHSVPVCSGSGNTNLAILRCEGVVPSLEGRTP